MKKILIYFVCTLLIVLSAFNTSLIEVKAAGKKYSSYKNETNELTYTEDNKSVTKKVYVYLAYPSAQSVVNKMKYNFITDSSVYDVELENEIIFGNFTGSGKKVSEKDKVVKEFLDKFKFGKTISKNNIFVIGDKDNLAKKLIQVQIYNSVYKTTAALYNSEDKEIKPGNMGSPSSSIDGSTGGIDNFKIKIKKSDDIIDDTGLELTELSFQTLKDILKETPELKGALLKVIMDATLTELINAAVTENNPTQQMELTVNQLDAAENLTESKIKELYVDPIRKYLDEVESSEVDKALAAALNYSKIIHFAALNLQVSKKLSSSNDLKTCEAFVNNIVGEGSYEKLLKDKSRSRAYATYVRTIYRLAATVSDTNAISQNYALALPVNSENKQISFEDLYPGITGIDERNPLINSEGSAAPIVDAQVTKITHRNPLTEGIIKSDKNIPRLRSDKVIYEDALSGDDIEPINMEVLKSVLPEGAGDPFDSTGDSFTGTNALRVGYFALGKILLAGSDIMNSNIVEMRNSNSVTEENYASYIHYNNLLINALTTQSGLAETKFNIGTNLIGPPPVITKFISWDELFGKGEQDADNQFNINRKWYNSVYQNSADISNLILLSIHNHLSSSEQSLFKIEDPKSISGIAIYSPPKELTEECQKFIDFMSSEKATNEFIETWDFTKEDGDTPAFTKGLVNDIYAYVKIKQLLGISSWMPILDRKVKSIESKILLMKNSVIFQLNYDNATDKDINVFEDFFDGSKATAKQTADTFTDSYKTGIAISASFIPLKTNVYEVGTWLPEQYSDWIKQFHLKYGFHRKALYIDTNASSVSKSYVDNKRGSVRIATLRDLLQPNGDISLYVGRNVYNADEVSSRMSLSTTKGVTDINDSKDLVEDKVNGIFESVSDFFTLTDNKAFLKTDGASQYSPAVRNTVNSVFGEKWAERFIAALKGGLTSASRANTVIRAIPYPAAAKRDFQSYTYSATQTRALIAGIYFQDGIFRTANEVALKNEPVFLSSPNAASINGVVGEHLASIYNYMLLKNITGYLDNDVRSTLDMDSPLFMDVYGNILTTTGIVVVPSATNATLLQEQGWSPFTASYFYYYGRAFKLPGNTPNSGTYVQNEDMPEDEENPSGEYVETPGFMTQRNFTNSPWFIKNDKTNEWELSTIYIDGIPITQQNFPVASTGMKISIINLFYRNVLGKGGDFSKLNSRLVNVILEVMRGAPIENINFEKEGIVGKNNYTWIGAQIANGLDMISEALCAGNVSVSPVSIPNPMFISGVEYIVLPMIKVSLVFTLIALIVHLYKDGLRGKVGIVPVLTFFRSVGLVIAAFLLFPIIIYSSYYLANKSLLRKEVNYIGMLNEEKRREGREVGIMGVKDISSGTKLWIKLEDISIPWYLAIDDVIYSSIQDTIEDLYDKAYGSSEFVNEKDIVKKANGIYVSLDSILDSTSMYYTRDSQEFINSTDKVTTFSYISPYYYILDSLVQEVNGFSMEHGLKTGVTSVDGKGHVVVKGGLNGFFLSPEVFPEEGNIPYDISGLFNLYGIKDKIAPYAPEDKLVRMSEDVLESYWFTPGAYEEEDVRNKLLNVERAGQRFIAENSSLLGRISDETFLKFLALTMAMEYNKQFEIPVGRAVEIVDLDLRDVYKLSVISRSKLYDLSGYSFGRQIYEADGAVTTFLSIIGIAVFWAASGIKFLLIILLIGLSIFTLVFRNLILRKESNAIQGFFLTMGLIAAMNFLYAVFIKLSFAIPNIVKNGVISVLIAIIIQILYLLGCAGIAVIQVKDWSDLGYNAIKNGIVNMATRFREGREGRVTNPNTAYEKASKFEATGTFKSEKPGTRRQSEDQGLLNRVGGMEGQEILNYLRSRDN